MQWAGLILSNSDKRFFVLYFLFLLLYFINFNRGQQYFVYGLLLLSCLPALWANRHIFRLSVPLRWAAALLLYLTLSFIWSDPRDFTDFFELCSKAALTLSFVLLTSYFVWKNPHELSRLLALLIACVAVLGVLSCFLFYAKQPFPDARLVSFGQLTNANYMGSVNGVFAVIAGYFTMVAKTTGKRVTYALILIVLSSVVALTQSRGAFIAMMVALAVVVIWQGRYRLLQYSIAGVLGIGCYVFGRPLILRLLVPESDASSALRQQIWQDALAQISRHPLLGAGIGSDMQFNSSGGLFEHPHSVYLTVAWYGGGLGLFLMLGMLVVAYRECIIEGRHRENYLPLALLLYTTLCVTVDYSDIITFPRDIWVQFWLAIAIAGGVGINRRLRQNV